MDYLPDIPGFVVTRLVGRGVYSHVFEAFPPSGRAMALKVLKTSCEDDAWIVQSFRREGAIGTSVRHPALIRIRDSQLFKPPYVHVCDFIDGSNLRGCRLLPIPTVIEIVAAAADALASLHRAGFIHGDVKPGNILLTASGRPVLIDLGFARKPGTFSRGEGIPGTPNYLAPELCCREVIDTPAVDLFALGVTAYELLTGELPYPALNDNNAVLRQRRDDRPRSIRRFQGAWPRALDVIIDQMLAFDRTERPAMEQVARALNAVRKQSRLAA